MKSIKMIDNLAVAIPTCCCKPGDIRIGYGLQSLAMQTPINNVKCLDIFIWDEGPVPIVSDRWTRLIIDLLIQRGNTVSYFRRNPSHGVAAARKGLLNEITAKHDFILMVDDDLLVMPGAIEQLLNAVEKVETFGFLQGTKIELDQQRIYHNDINRLNRKRDSQSIERLYFGDAAFLLVHKEALRHVRWDIVTKFREEGLAGEDVAISLMISDKLPCFGVPDAVGYHLSFENPRWNWESTSDVLQIELLKGVVSDETLKAALPHLAHYLGIEKKEIKNS